MSTGVRTRKVSYFLMDLPRGMKKAKTATTYHSTHHIYVPLLLILTMCEWKCGRAKKKLETGRNRWKVVEDTAGARLNLRINEQSLKLTQSALSNKRLMKSAERVHCHAGKQNMNDVMCNTTSIRTYMVFWLLPGGCCNEQIARKIWQKFYTGCSSWHNPDSNLQPQNHKTMALTSELLQPIKTIMSRSFKGEKNHVEWCKSS